MKVKQDRLDRHLKDHSLPTFGGAASTRVNAQEREELLPITQNGEKSMNGFGKAFRSVDGAKGAIFCDGTGNQLRDFDPSPISLIPFRRGARSSFRAEHVSKPMPRDCVGCHNRGTRRGHDHDDDGSSRNRQIVDDPA